MRKELLATAALVAIVLPASAADIVYFRATSRVVTGEKAEPLAIGAIQPVRVSMGSPVSFKVAATGGSGGYVHSFAGSASSRPAWLTMTPDGTVSGTASVGRWPAVRFSVADSKGASVETSSLVEAAAPLTASPAPVEVEIGSSISATISPTGGLEAYSFAFAGPSSERPAWLTIDAATGKLGGSPDAVGSWPTVRIRIASGTESFEASLAVTSKAAPTANFVSTLTGAGEQYGRASAAAPSGAIHVAGSTGSDQLVAGYAADGNLTWQKSLGANGLDYALNIAATAGGTYVCGYSADIGAGQNDASLVKYDASGAVLWQKTLGGTQNDIFRKVAVGPSGNVYAVGETFSTGRGDFDILLAKYASDGTLLWQKTIGGTGSDQGIGLAVGPGDAVYVVGSTYNGSKGSGDVLVLKLDSLGATQWQRVLGTTSYDGGQDVAVAANGSIVVGGFLSANNNDGLLASYSSTGVLAWMQTFGGPDYEIISSVATASDGSIFVSGTVSAGAGGNDMFVGRYGSDGAPAWQRTLGNGGSDQGNDVAVGGPGILLTGNITGTGYDILLAGLTVDGAGTGTIGSVTYAASTIPQAAASSSVVFDSAVSSSTIYNDTPTSSAIRDLTPSTIVLKAATTTLTPLRKP